jgi:acyl carrier protein
MEASYLLQRVRDEIVRELEIRPEDLRDTASLRTYGMDSVAAVTIIFRLESELGIEIDVRKLVGVDTIDQLKAVVEREIFDKERHCSRKHG